MKQQVATLGIDIAKNVFQVCGVTAFGKSVFNKKVTRSKLLSFLAQQPSCIVGMEACSSSHYWAREISKLGHEVKLMPPQYVKPYVKTNKSDHADAQAICEAVTRPSMRFSGVKTEEQQALLLLHRDRSGLVRDRTALVNRLRASLAEFGITVPAGINRLRHWLSHDYGKFESELSMVMRGHVYRMAQRLKHLDCEISTIEGELKYASSKDNECERLLEVPGIGQLTASAIVATVGDAKVFKNGRQFAAWLGLVPRQHSSGGKPQLFGISKRGDSYLRALFIHGARAVIRHSNPKREVTNWINDLLSRRHKNVVIVALANKLARIAWALLAKQTAYTEGYA
jgi:transposase